MGEWAHMLIKELSDIQFNVFCITPNDEQQSVYSTLPNVDRIVLRPLVRNRPELKSNPPTHKMLKNLPNLFKQMAEGHALDLESIIDPLQHYPINKTWLSSKQYWDGLVYIYNELCPNESMIDFFWTMFGFTSPVSDSFNFINEMPEADIYHSLSTGFAGYACSLVKAARHKPLVTTEQGLYLVERRLELSRIEVSALYREVVNKFSESLVKTTYKYADRIVPPCYSPHTKIEKELGADPKKITVIHNGIQVERFNPEYHESDIPVIGCFARIVPIKGILDLIKAAKIVLQNCPAEFVVLGEVQDPIYHQECLKLVEELGISKSFKMMGHVNAVEWYHKVDIFTLSSLSEGVPYALLEAMSSGLPSVCTGVGGIPEMLSEEVGFVVPPAQPEALAEKLCVLVNDKELRRRMGTRATVIAKEQFTIAEMARQFREVYEGLLK